MPRTGSCWPSSTSFPGLFPGKEVGPSLRWLHCTGRCRNSWHRNLWTSYPEPVRQTCSRPRCNSFFQHMIWRKRWRFCLPRFLILFWVSSNCQVWAKGMPYRFQEHSHPNSLVTDIGNTWWRVLQTKAEDHYYMPVLGSRLLLKGRCYEVLLVKLIEFFLFSTSMTEIPPKVSWLW